MKTATQEIKSEEKTRVLGFQAARELTAEELDQVSGGQNWDGWTRFPGENGSTEVVWDN